MDHAIPCHKLEHYDLQVNELQLFNSYHVSHKQYCRVGGYDSNIENNDIGVPQRSCLGPLLLLIHINSLPQVVKASTVSIYPDDTNLTFQSQDISRLNNTIIDGLNSLGLWMQGISNC